MAQLSTEVVCRTSTILNDQDGYRRWLTGCIFTSAAGNTSVVYMYRSQATYPRLSDSSPDISNRMSFEMLIDRISVPVRKARKYAPRKIGSSRLVGVPAYFLDFKL